MKRVTPHRQTIHDQFSHLSEIKSMALSDWETRLGSSSRRAVGGNGASANPGESSREFCQVEANHPIGTMAV
jgi:hypothetical protein